MFKEIAPNNGKKLQENLCTETFLIVKLRFSSNKPNYSKLPYLLYGTFTIRNSCEKKEKKRISGGKTNVFNSKLLQTSRQSHVVHASFTHTTTAKLSGQH